MSASAWENSTQKFLWFSCLRSNTKSKIFSKHFLPLNCWLQSYSRFDFVLWLSRNIDNSTHSKKVHRSFPSAHIYVFSSELSGSKIFSNLLYSLQNAKIVCVWETKFLINTRFFPRICKKKKKKKSHYKFLWHLMAWRGLIPLPPLPPLDWSFILLGKNSICDYFWLLCSSGNHPVCSPWPVFPRSHQLLSLSFNRSS